VAPPTALSERGPRRLLPGPRATDEGPGYEPGLDERERNRSRVVLAKARAVRERRERLARLLAGVGEPVFLTPATSDPDAGRWMPGMPLDWVPLAPTRVVDVACTQVDDHRLRHPARLVRWRPDRDPRSCRLEQLDVSRPPVDELLRR